MNQSQPTPTHKPNVIRGRYWSNTKRQQAAHRRIERMVELASAGRLNGPSVQSTSHSDKSLFERPPFNRTIWPDIVYLYKVSTDFLQRPLPNSVLQTILEAAKRLTNGEFENTFKAVCRKNRGEIFKAVCSEFHGHSSLRRGIEDARVRHLIRTSPDSLEKLPPELAAWVQIGLIEEGQSWITKKERKPALNCEQIGHLCFFWLDENCPLWLMSPKARLETCRALFPEFSWTEESINGCLSKTSLGAVRCKPSLIEGVKITHAQDGTKRLGTFQLHHSLHELGDLKINLDDYMRPAFDPGTQSFVVNRKRKNLSVR